VLTFQRENVRLGAAELEQLGASDAFAAMVGLAQTTVYDTRLIAPRVDAVAGGRSLWYR